MHAAVKNDEIQEDIRRSWSRDVSIDSYHGIQMLMEINKHRWMVISIKPSFEEIQTVPGFKLPVEFWSVRKHMDQIGST